MTEESPPTLEEAKRERWHRGDRLGRPWDPRAALAMLCVLGAIAIQVMILMDPNDAHAMPNWIVALVSSVVSYYFGAKNGSGYKKP